MQNKRSITPAVHETTKPLSRPRLRASLVSDRLGAQGFTSSPEDRSAELPLGADRIIQRAGQELGAPPREPGRNEGLFEQN